MVRSIVNRVGRTALLLSLVSVPLLMSGQDQPAAPDNTKQNKMKGPTADDQKNNKADRETSQKIRKAILADKSLSSYAHNVKIITVHGSVALKGPVRSNEEKAAVEAKATEIAGASNVTSELTVAPKNQN
jgi:hyperosmotically inducible periplasmic protein